MSSPRPPQVQAAYEHCRAVARREAKNFYYAFLALPRAKSDAMCAVYAFMRRADDLSDDESISLEDRRTAMAAWTNAWRTSRTGTSDDPVFIALADVQRRFDVPDALLEQLVAGTTLDLEQVQQGVEALQLPDGTTVQVYRTLDDLKRYCYLVASVVGLVCIKIFGYRDPAADALAVDTGIAFQLTNILRDVVEDADRHRVYLPQDLLQKHGLTPSDVLSAEASGVARLKPLLDEIAAEAERLYGSSDRLIPMLDRDAQPAMRVLVTIYHRLLDRIRPDTSQVFAGRVSVPTTEKLTILASGLMQSLRVRFFG